MWRSLDINGSRSKTVHGNFEGQGFPRVRKGGKRSEETHGKRASPLARIYVAWLKINSGGERDSQWRNRWLLVGGGKRRRGLPEVMEGLEGQIREERGTSRLPV